MKGGRQKYILYYILFKKIAQENFHLTDAPKHTQSKQKCCD